MPIDRGIIDQQLQDLGEGSRWWDQRELRDLPAILNAGERILAIARGKIARIRWLRRSWLIVVTESRLLCIRSGTRSWRQVAVSTDQIAGVTLRVGPFRGRVIFFVAGQAYRILVPRQDAYKLVSALSQYNTPPKVGYSGPTRMVRRVVDHVLALPAAAFDPGAPRSTAPSAPPDGAGVQQRLDSLEEEVQQLRQQVDFLEQLLRQRQNALPRPENALSD